MDFDGAVIRGERFASHLETVAAEWKIAGDELAGVVSGERAVELEGVAREIDRDFEREAIGTEDCEAELSGAALGVGRESQEQEGGNEVEQESHVRERGVFMLSVSRRSIGYEGNARRESMRPFYKLFTSI